MPKFYVDGEMLEVKLSDPQKIDPNYLMTVVKVEQPVLGLAYQERFHHSANVGYITVPKGFEYTTLVSYIDSKGNGTPWEEVALNVQNTTHIPNHFQTTVEMAASKPEAVVVEDQKAVVDTFVEPTVEPVVESVVVAPEVIEPVVTTTEEILDSVSKNEEVVEQVEEAVEPVVEEPVADPVVAEEPAVEPVVTEEAVEDPVADEIVSLSARTQRALRNHTPPLLTKQSVLDFMAEGKKLDDDINGIGPAGVKEIMEWLA